MEIPNFEQAKQQILPKLTKQGYAYLWRKDHPPGHMMFIKGLPPHSPRTHHLHFAPADHKLWERLYFTEILHFLQKNLRAKVRTINFNTH